MSIGEILLRSRYQPLKRVLSYDVSIPALTAG